MLLAKYFCLLELLLLICDAWKRPKYGHKKEKNSIFMRTSLNVWNVPANTGNFLKKYSQARAIAQWHSDCLASWGSEFVLQYKKQTNKTKQNPVDIGMAKKIIEERSTKIPKYWRRGGLVVECSTSIHEAMGSSPSTTIINQSINQYSEEINCSRL